jgi:hypothetical protein
MTPEEQYRQDVDAAHRTYRERVVELHREFDHVKVLTPAGTWGWKSGFAPALKTAEKARNFALVRAAQRRNRSLEQE